VLELAFGTGRNLPYYPADVRLTAIELSPRMLEIGRQRANELGRKVDLRLGDAQALEFHDQSFDTVIITFGLCTIPDDRAAVTEAHSVLRPGGRLVLLEHVRSPSTPVVPCRDCSTRWPSASPPTTWCETRSTTWGASGSRSTACNA
jgi:ubiquinone/menaquinone biosynthesis C-methylase UbiE